MNLPIGLDQDKLIAMASIAKEGSPFLLKSLGRVVGLGDSEQKAILDGKIPWWAWAGLGLGVGFLAGARIERKYSGKIPAIIAGKK